MVLFTYTERRDKMKAATRRAFAFIMCLVLTFTASATAFAADTQATENWTQYWKEYTDEGRAIMVQPGSDESERYISWYSAAGAGEGYVLISGSEDMASPVKFSGTFTETNQGDIRNNIVVSGLEKGETYYYQCCNGNEKSSAAEINTVSGNDFSALYVTDIHISYDETNENSVSEQAFKWNSVLAAANEREDISLVLSAGDQGSAGLRSEYEGLVASPYARNMSIATTVGNHDIKYTDYKAFHFVPNESTNGTIHNFISADYWFTKGNTLFMVLDSNCQSIPDHRAFMASAVKANPDAKWRIMMFHHDLYGGRIEHRESECKLMRLLYTPLADEFSVDLVLLGHSHYYTISNVMYGNKTVTETAGLSSVENAAGTIYMVSGSINRPRTLDESETPPLGENAGHSYLTDEMIYNILDFTEDSITVKSYTLESGECFNTFTLFKTSAQGGHDKTSTPFYEPAVRILSKIYAFFDKIVRCFKFFNKFYLGIDD